MAWIGAVKLDATATCTSSAWAALTQRQAASSSGAKWTGRMDRVPWGRVRYIAEYIANGRQTERGILSEVSGGRAAVIASKLAPPGFRDECMIDIHTEPCGS